MQAIPEPMQRNQVVWDTWSASVGTTERDRADMLFNSEQFEHVRDRCLWHEHEAQAIGPDGQPAVKNNDVNRLKDIIRENNTRIADTDAYTALVDKHTVAPGQRDPLPPKTLGFVGPYRLGMIGRVNPRFAIFADEHHRKDRAEVLRDRPRRSVEVLTLRANGRSYIDPIAALSEAPRLPLPVQYSAERVIDDEPVEVDVERYESDGGAVMPGGGNTYIPGQVKKPNPNKYGPDGEAAPSPENQSMLSPDDIRQVVDAVLSTPQMKFLEQLMTQGGQGAEQPGDPGQGPPDGEPAEPAGGTAPPVNPAGAAVGAAAPPQPPQDPTKMQAGQYGGHQQYMPRPMAGGVMSNAVANRFGAAESEDEYEVEEPMNQDQPLAEQYAALSEDHNKLRGSHGRLIEKTADQAARIAELEKYAADAGRRERITGIASKYPHMVDIDEELDRVLYSAGTDMDDTDFERYCEQIERFAAKAPATTRMVPGGEMPSGPQNTVEKYEADRVESKRAVEIYTAALERGETMTYEQCVEKAREQPVA